MARLAALILAVLLALPAARAAAQAAVNVNTATQAELETVRGIGPATSARIVEERRRSGPFRDLDDLQARVKGIGENNVRKMAAAGLTVGGRAAPAASGVGTARSRSAAGAPAHEGAPVETIVGMPRADAATAPAAPAAAAKPGSKPGSKPATQAGAAQATKAGATTGAATSTNPAAPGR